jgi:hypothetical protein
LCHSGSSCSNTDDGEERYVQFVGELRDVEERELRREERECVLDCTIRSLAREVWNLWDLKSILQTDHNERNMMTET